MSNYAKVAQMLDEKDKEIERLRSALREIVETPIEVSRSDGEVYVHWKPSTMHRIAKEALGDE